MKICHVCSAHSVDDGRVFHRACVTLAEAGYEVHLIATGEGDTPYTEKGVHIHPLPRPTSRRQRLARRSTVAKMAIGLDPDLLHVHEPELLGPVIAHAGRRPVIWDVHESYLDVLAHRSWIPRWLRPLMRLAWDLRERRLVRRCAGVIVVTEPIAQRYRRLHDNTYVIANYPELPTASESATSSRLAAHEDDSAEKSCVFAGSLASNRGLSQTLVALSVLDKRGLAVPLVLAGRQGRADYIDSLLQEAETLGIRHLVTYHGVLSKAETLVLMGQSYMGLVPHLPYGNNLTAWPVKMFEFMSLGLPMVFSDFPVHQQITGESGAGIAIDPHNPEEFANAIEYLIRHPDEARQMGEAGKRAVSERFNWNTEKTKLLDLYQEILAATASHYPR